MTRTSAFPKQHRLRRRSEFLEVQERGVKVSTDCLLAVAQRNTRGVTRLGLTVSSKVGNSVTRNRIRRVLREIFRVNKAAWPAGVDVVLIARASAAKAERMTFEQAMGRLRQELRRRFPPLTPSAAPAPAP